VELAFPDMPAALQAGRVDAIWVVEPFLSTSRSQHGRLVASNYVDTAPDLTVAVYFTSEQLIKNDPDLVKRFTEAMTESLAYADAHPERGPPGAHQLHPDRRGRHQGADPAQVAGRDQPGSVETLATLAVQDGLVTKQPDLNALLP